MRLPSPPGFATPGLTDHFRRLQQELELEDLRNLKLSDIPTRTTRAWDSYSTSVTIGQGQDIVLVDATAGSVTVTLPPAAERFKEFTIKKIDSSVNTVVVAADGAELIDGAATQTLSSQYDALNVGSNGSAWWVL